MLRSSPMEGEQTWGTCIECGVSYAKIRQPRIRITLHLVKQIERYFSQVGTHTVLGLDRTIQAMSYSRENRVNLEESF